MAEAASDVRVRYCSSQDFDWLYHYEKEFVSEEWVRRCLGHKEYLIAVDSDTAEERIGYIRYSFFWGTVPYMDKIRVADGQQRRGVGSAMFKFWEEEVRRKGYKILMTSSLRDDLEPLAWHWRNGFRESGKLTFGSFDSNPEIFYIKDLD